MNYKEARLYLKEITAYGSILGLTSIRTLLEHLGNPQDDLKFIHIAGTNGKGSVLAFISTVLKEAGFKVGRYISPTLYAYEERIQINGTYISKEKLAKHTTIIKDAVERMVKEGSSHPTAFEVETALSFLYYKEEMCDIVVLETGLGGELDATNVIRHPVLAILTSISMDHMGFLGNTLSEIAKVKAGIIKQDSVVVSYEHCQEAMKEIEDKCLSTNSKLIISLKEEIADVMYGLDRQLFSYKNMHNIEISLGGKYQIQNAALALEAIMALGELGYEISDNALRAGFRNTKWIGRFTVIANSPLFIVDGAHNIDGALKLKESIELYFQDKTIRFIMGVFKDKEYEKIAEITSPLAVDIVAIQTPDNLRALEATRLLRVISRYNPNVSSAVSIQQAVTDVMKKANEKDVIIAFGSLSFLGDILHFFHCPQE